MTDHFILKSLKLYDYKFSLEASELKILTSKCGSYDIMFGWLPKIHRTKPNKIENPPFCFRPSKRKYLSDEHEFFSQALGINKEGTAGLKADRSPGTDFLVTHSTHPLVRQHNFPSLIEHALFLNLEENQRALRVGNACW